MNKIVIGFTGEMGCGKDTATEYLFKRYGGVKFKFSQSLREILDRIGVPTTRENLSEISRILRESFGQDRLAKIMALDVNNSEASIILIDGVRRKDDIVHLTRIPEFKLVYIETSLQNRFDRIKQRGENEDDLSKTMEDFIKDHELETEVQIRGLKDIADYVIDNNGTYEELFAQIDEIVKK